MPKRRLASLDIAKCLAISFIIIGHTGLSYPFSVPGGMPGEIVSFSFTFHLPVFFIVGGYFFPSETGLSAELVRKDARRLLLPYAVTSALIVVGCALTAHAHGEGAKLEALKWAEAALWGAGAKSGVALWDVERIGGIWFLLAVFWAHLLIAATYRLDEWQRLLVMCVCTAVAAASARHVWLPLSIQSGMGCALYIYVGMLLRRNDGLEKRLPPLLIPVLAVTWGYAIYRAGGGSLALQEYPLGSFTVLGGISAALLVVAFSRGIEAHAPHLSPAMQAIGRITLPILCMHILEDDVLRWWEIGAFFSKATGGAPCTWLIVLALRVAVEAALVGIVYAVPFLRSVYFPSRSAKRSS